jgi:16S rRNA G1207 methylase RsmC
MTIKNSTEIKFTVSPNEEIQLKSASGVFTPNATTSLLIQAVMETVTGPVNLLDLGCGTGVVGIALNLKGLITQPLYASDLSQSSIICSKENFDRHGCEADVRGGSLFTPWNGMKFDVIVDDISGIAKSVADVSPWFQGVPCETGEDGVDLVVEILRNAPQYLNEGGHLFFPVLSLSNVDKILRVAKENFASVERIGRKDWPLPKELITFKPLLQKLYDEGSIKFEEQFGMVLCYTEVYCATNPY